MKAVLAAFAAVCAFAQPSFVGATSAKSSAPMAPASITLFVPSGLQPGDTLITTVAFSGYRTAFNAAEWAAGYQPPAGWEPLCGTPTDSTSVWNVLIVSRHVYGLADPPSFTWKLPRYWGYVAAMQAYRDVSPVQPICRVSTRDAIPKPITTTAANTAVLVAGFPDWPESFTLAQPVIQRWNEMGQDNAGSGGDFVQVAPGETPTINVALGPPGVVGGLAVTLALERGSSVSGQASPMTLLPAPSLPCSVGQASIDAQYFYVCTQAGTWKRTPLY